MSQIKSVPLLPRKEPESSGLPRYSKSIQREGTFKLVMGILLRLNPELPSLMICTSPGKPDLNSKYSTVRSQSCLLRQLCPGASLFAVGEIIQDCQYPCCGDPKHPYGVLNTYQSGDQPGLPALYNLKHTQATPVTRPSPSQRLL